MRNALMRSTAEGHRIGCVPKPSVGPSVEARVIYDLFYPRPASTNDKADQDTIPELTYNHIDAIARRILSIHDQPQDVPIYLMKEM
ncbi:hypothetical protein PHMEG_00015723 [Phytophthora megakarya]|uniref:Uncharacterized protein n=1 Tax=Phytophthora megakarya TaxID=4795 RepID=A0A225W349_9STRA|nr:hypothetical protein PHMEG_00015723 [Phytophthora megakarya]